MLTPNTSFPDYATIEAARIPWRQVAAAITDMMAVVDADGHTVFFNEPLEVALARPMRPDLAMADHPIAYGLYHLDGTLYRPEELPLARALQRGERVTDVEVVFRRPDGGQVITHWSAAPLRDDTGAIVGAVGTGRDVTAQTRSHKWLQASERRALLLAELGSHFAASLDLREVLLRVARSIVEALGEWCTIDLVHDGDPARLRTAAVYHHDPDQAAQMGRLRRRQPLPGREGMTGQVLATGEPLWIHSLTPDLLQAVASPAEVAMTPLLQATALLILPLPGRQQVLGVLTVGVTESLRRESFTEDDYALAQEVASRAALAIENAQLYEYTRRQVARLAGLRDVALALSRSLVLSESGPPALAALLRASRTQMAALYVRDPEADQLVCITSVGFDPAGPGPPPVVSAAEDSLARRAVALGRPHYSGDGTEVPAPSRMRMAAWGVRSFVSLPITGPGQVIGSLILLARAPRRFSRADIAFLESAANQIALSIENGRLYQHTRELLAEVERSNQLKDEFISIASHELRTPLTAVRGYAEMMLRRLSKQPGRTADVKSLETIYVQVDRMNRLITDLLDVSRMTGDRLELRLQRLDLGALVRHVLEQQQPLAPQHPFMVDMVPPIIIGLWDGPRLEQVLLNLLNNAVKYTPQGGLVAITLRGDRERGQVTVAVRDEGIGIPPESLPQLFTRFYRAPNARQGRGGGLGIGLYVSLQIVRAHGGEITVDSTPGAGTTFTIHLPWRSAAPLA